MATFTLEITKDNNETVSINRQDYVNKSVQDLSHGTSWSIYVDDEFAQVKDNPLSSTIEIPIK